MAVLPVEENEVKENALLDFFIPIFIKLLQNMKNFMVNNNISDCTFRDIAIIQDSLFYILQITTIFSNNG